MFFYTFMPKLFNMSLTASVAIVFVILLRLLLKKAPKVISYALWGVVLFRLLCPVSIGSSFSVYNLFDAPAQESGTITSVIEYVPSNIVHTVGCRPARSSNVHCYLCLDDWRVGHGNLQYCLLHPAAA